MYIHPFIHLAIQPAIHLPCPTQTSVRAQTKMLAEVSQASMTERGRFRLPDTRRFR